MESKVKSRISNKTYTALLDTLDSEDRDVDSELYQVAISGRNIMIAPGKTRMEDGVAYCYAYVILRNKVECKLGVYEKKTESMPMMFDLSTFPEGSFCLFEEFEKNPSKLVDLEMSDVKSIFDYLIQEVYPKMEDKKNKLKLAYRNLYETLKRDENKNDKDFKWVLKLISDESKLPEPKDTFLYAIKEKATDQKQFVVALLALQYVFQVDFVLLTDEPSFKELKKRWTVGKVKTVMEVDVSTQELIQERGVRPEIQEAEPEVQEAPEDVQEATAETKGQSVSLDEDVKETEPQPLETIQEETIPEQTMPKPPVQGLLQPLGPPKDDYAIDLEEVKPKKKRETKPKASAAIAPALGTSLNSVIETKPEPKVKAPRKIKLKPKPEA